MQRNLPEKRILITGAGSGLGRATALHFARNGWKVAATDRDEGAARRTLTELKELGAEGLTGALDVTSEESFAEVVARLERVWGGVDVIVNNAGIATAGSVAEAPMSQWGWVLNINLLGCVRGSRAVIPLMTKQKGGHIVNIASFAGIANPPGMASYNVAKAGVVSLSETLRFEMAPHGVGVTVVCPEFFKTNLIETTRQHAPKGTMVESAAAERVTQRLMDKATLTAESLAAEIYNAVMDNRFLVIEPKEAKQRYHIKRIAPEYYFKKALAATAKFMAKLNS